jgi:hypothetical protein
MAAQSLEVLPGASIGTLTINNTLSLGGTNLMEINKTAATNDLITGLTSVTYGGVLSVTNLSGALAAGDASKLFDASSYSGTFASITPASPGAGLAWNTTDLTLNGTLRIVTAVTPPHFNGPVLAGSTLTLSGGGGTPNTDYYVLVSTNVSLPVTNWDRLVSNQFDGSGNFSFNVNVIPAIPQRFFLIQLP